MIEVDGRPLDGDSLEDPCFEKAGRVHDWRNHVGARARALWPTLPHEVRVALALDADDRASDEVWE
jgi:hypothetical protein